ncbi:MAG TPA: glutamate racemase [Candidatus Bathyarchaeia archaeon]|nr:glutamate racemase [Candidatus Bathyarchaeia archaeon]
MKKRHKANAPIGVFDSGLGGLTVVKAIRKVLPLEDIVYFGDTARVPYGTKSPQSIVKFSQQNAKVLMAEGVKAIVIACNSSSSYALELLQKEFPLPIIGVIQPGVNKALKVAKTGKIGVIATPATIKSQSYQNALIHANPSCRIFAQACPLFVPLVEEGWFTHAVTRQVAQEYLKKMKASRIDALILGCTHYPLLKGILQKVMGRSVSLIDSAHEVACELQELLRVKDLLCSKGKKKNECRFLVSDEPDHFQKLAKRFLGEDIPTVKKLF